MKPLSISPVKLVALAATLAALIAPPVGAATSEPSTVERIRLQERAQRVQLDASAEPSTVNRIRAQENATLRALQAASAPATSAADRFDWADAGYGLASGVGLSLLAAAVLFLARNRRLAHP